MRNRATYRRYAEECRRLARIMPAENRHVHSRSPKLGMIWPRATKKMILVLTATS
jgi:hypothetical protein